MISVLLLTCGTNACYHFARILKENFNGAFRIIGADINKYWMVSCAQFLDEFYQCPYTESNEYYRFILNVCKKEHVKYILPIFDADQQLFYDGNPDLHLIGVKSFGIPETIRSMYSNKKETNKYLATIGIPIPKHYNLSNIREGNNYFIKPQNGNGSVGAKVVVGKDILIHKEEELIIQEICSEPEVTLECFYNNGQLRSIARVRLDCKSGVCTKTKIYQDNSLHSIAEKFVLQTNVPHIFNLQFMRNSKGNYVVTDVNLRPAAGMSLSYTAGWDVVSALAKIMLNKNQRDILETVSTQVTDQYIVRAYTDIVTKKIKSRIAFDLDGTLLDSRCRHSSLMADLLSSKGIDIPTCDLVSFKSNMHNNIEWLQSKGVSEDEAKEINAMWIRDIEKYEYLIFDQLYEGVRELLNDMSKDFELYLITARNNVKTLQMQLKDIDILQFFTEVVVVESNTLTTSRKSEELRKRCIDILIGDTESDLEAATGSECCFFASTYGFRSSKFWNKFQVNKVNNVQEIQKKINNFLNTRNAGFNL